MRTLAGMFGAAALMGTIMALPVANAQTLVGYGSQEYQLSVYEVADCSDLDMNAKFTLQNAETTRVNTFFPLVGASATIHSDTWWTMICEANNWAIQGVNRGGNLNGDRYGAEEKTFVRDASFRLVEVDHPLQGEERIDERDAQIMYFSYFTANELLGEDPSNVTERVNTMFPLTDAPSPTDQTFLDMISAAWTLLCTTHPALEKDMLPREVRRRYATGHACSP